MDKIVIIGSPGAGKTTLARALGPVFNLKVYHLDRLFWQRGWKAKTRDTSIDILQNLVREKQWIIEGTYLHLSELHLDAADTIIFLDISSLLCPQRLIKRHHEYNKRFRRDIPKECTDRLTLFRIFKVLTFPLHGRRTIKQSIRNYNSKHIIWLHSAKEVEDFLVQQKQDADDKSNSSDTVLVANKRNLVAAR